MSCPPASLDEDEVGWDAALPTPASSAPRPVPFSIPPSTPDDEGESWEAAPEAGDRQSPKALASTDAAPEPTVEKPEREPSQRARASSDEREKSSLGGSRVALLIVAAAVVGGAWLFLRPKGEPPAAQPPHEPKLERAQQAFDPGKPVIAPPEPAKAEPGAAPTVSDATTAASAAASNAPTAPEGAAAEPAPSSEDLIVVTVSTVPPDARFFYKGKPVGRSPFRVELKPGQRRSFEIGRPGFYARKVVVDGTKQEMTVEMRPEIRQPEAPAE